MASHLSRDLFHEMIIPVAVLASGVRQKPLVLLSYLVSMPLMASQERQYPRRTAGVARRSWQTAAQKGVSITVAMHRKRMILDDWRSTSLQLIDSLVRGRPLQGGGGEQGQEEPIENSHLSQVRQNRVNIINQDQQQRIILRFMLESIQLLSYRNGFYQGQLKNEARHGFGIMIRDDGVLIVADWKNDLAFGKAFVIVNSEQYALAEFSRGELDGNCYFRGEKEMLFGPFRAGKPIDRQLSINFVENKAKVMAFRNGSYETLKEFTPQSNNQSHIVEQYLGQRINKQSPVEFLQREFSSQHIGFELQELQNGSVYFQYRQKGNPQSLGFVLNSRNQIVSYGTYLEGKLHGFGCKVDSGGKYEGQFEAGQLSGYGMVYSNGRYSFGGFQGGKLVQPIHLEERSPESQTKLKQLKKKNHIQSNYFFNNYISKDIMKFRGISEVTILSSFLRDFLYDRTQPNTQLTSSNLKGSNVSLNQALSSRVRPAEDHRSVFQSSQASRSREGEWEERRWMGGQWPLEGSRHLGT